MLGKLKAAGEGDNRGRDKSDGITDSMDMSFEKALGVADGQGAWHVPWGRKELDTTERLN